MLKLLLSPGATQNFRRLEATMNSMYTALIKNGMINIFVLYCAVWELGWERPLSMEAKEGTVLLAHD